MSTTWALQTLTDGGAIVTEANVPTTAEKSAIGGTSGMPGSANKFVTDADPRVPSQDENDALAGTNGTPSGANKFMTDTDPRVPTTSEKSALAGTSGSPGSANKYVTDVDARVPSQDENDALQGTSGTPSNANRYVTDNDTRLAGGSVSAVQTTNATATTIKTVAVATDKAVFIETQFAAMKSDQTDAAGYIVRALYKNVAGTVTQIGGDAIDTSFESDTTWGGPSTTVSGTDVLIQVTGKVATVINWSVQAETIAAP